MAKDCRLDCGCSPVRSCDFRSWLVQVRSSPSLFPVLGLDFQTLAQQNYAVHELETLAILEALIKWEDKLIGHKISIITDHKALEFFKTQARLLNRQFRWIDYMSRFDFDIMYVKGEYNKVANCQSQYYENDTSADIHEYYDYVQADLRIDPTGEDLPSARYEEVVEKTIEMHAMHAMEL